MNIRIEFNLIAMRVSESPEEVTTLKLLLLIKIANFGNVQRKAEVIITADSSFHTNNFSVSLLQRESVTRIEASRIPADIILLFSLGLENSTVLNLYSCSRARFFFAARVSYNKFLASRESSSPLPIKLV